MTKIPLSYIGHYKTVGELVKDVRKMTDVPLDQVLIERHNDSFMLYELKFKEDSDD